MNIIEPKVELLKQEGRYDGMLKHIEVCGRTCYKSEDKMTDDSAKQFVDTLIKLGHTSVLEHGTVYLTFPINRKTRIKKVHFPWYYNNAESTLDEVFSYVQFKFLQNPYSVVKLHTDDNYEGCTMCITTNYRVIVENGWEDIMKEFISEPTLYHEKRITLKFTTNIGVTREGNRHRKNSISEESTRFCNYSKDKFNKQITFAKPFWIDQLDLDVYNEEGVRGEFDFDSASNLMKAIHVYQDCLFTCQKAYNKLIELGWTPQQAREVLPLATKSDVVYTATTSQWKHFFDLRLFGVSGVPHPNMYEICDKARDILIKEDLWQLMYPYNNKEE